MLRTHEIDLAIMRLLGEARTASYVSQNTKRAKSTVLAHLEGLVAFGLVKRVAIEKGERHVCAYVLTDLDAD